MGNSKNQQPTEAFAATPARRGRWAEQVALAYLRWHGLRLLDRNYRCKVGEIDLIMADSSALQEHILVFVEVRYRQSTRYGSPAATVTAAKQKKLVRTASLFCKQHQQWQAWPARFDVLALHGSGVPQINWIKAAFIAF